MWRHRNRTWIALGLAVALIAGMTSAAQAQGLYTPYGPYGPVLRPYNPYLPFTPGQQRGWQEAKIYEQTGLLPIRPLTPNEAAVFNRTILRDAWRQAYPGYVYYYPW